ncbi:DUF4303 domain-containing protein [Pigmentiphaga aceris]|nr:DUF4303 domain-containing protein [Pigmentiphaga aceris]
MDWKTLETHLTVTACATLDKLLASNVGTLYAAAFFGSYREDERVIDLPSLAANTLAALDEDHPKRGDEGFWSVKWSPVDWRWTWEPSDYGDETLHALDASLQAYANRGTPEQWDAAETRFMATVARAAAAVRKHFAKHPQVDKHFVVFFHDDAHGPALAKTSMSDSLFLRHFPEQDETEQTRRRLAGLPESEQAAYYVNRLDKYDGIDGETASDWLVAHGKSALPLLVEHMAKGKDAWKTAMILGLAGVADPTAIAALRKGTTAKGESTWGWSARALGYLGDVEWLLTQPTKIAMAGCCANLSAFRDRGALPLTLDYGPVERLLAQWPELAADVEELLKPGSSFCTIRVGDVPEAIRGLQSSHVVIRRHAACVLNERRLGKQGVAKAIAALKTCEDDSDEKMRYLVGLALDGLRA